jgi:hypothetical protein
MTLGNKRGYPFREIGGSIWIANQPLTGIIDFARRAYTGPQRLAASAASVSETSPMPEPRSNMMPRCVGD